MPASSACARRWQGDIFSMPGLISLATSEKTFLFWAADCTNVRSRQRQGQRWR